MLWAAAMWLFSTQVFTTASTSRYLIPLLKWLFPSASPATLLLVHALIRKLAHVAEYVVLSMLVLRGVRGDRRGWRLTWALAALAIALSYAALDEVHQLFVPGRGGSARDVLLDGCGAAIGQLLAKWFSPREEK